jgi:hypothetical protein
MVRRFIRDTPFDMFWFIICVIVGYGLIILVSDMFIIYWKSPVWIELLSNQMNVKKRFGQPFSIAVSDVLSVNSKKFWQVWGSFDIKVVCLNYNLYLNKSRCKDIDRFIESLKSANPNCQIDDFVK